jgi:alpha-N-arabinofuranosidase
MFPQPCFVGRRQEHLACRVEALLSFEPAHEGDEAGLSVFQNMLHHYDVAVTKEAGGRTVIVRRRVGTLVAVVASRALAEGDVRLVVEAEPQTYRFAIVDADGTRTDLAEGEARYLSSEVGGRFTGVYFAMYATGNGTVSKATAAFDWFEYAGVAGG